MSFVFLMILSCGNNHQSDNPLITDSKNYTLKQYTTTTELEAFFKQLAISYVVDMHEEGDSVTVKSGNDTSTADSAPAMESSSSYSTTNTQVADIDEADIVKTDGEFIYVLSNNKLHIIQATDLNELSALTFDDTLYPTEMLIFGNTAVILANYYSYSQPSSPYYETNWMYLPSSETRIELYDISDKTNPQKIRELSYEGSYQTSRLLADGNLHVILESQNTIQTLISNIQTTYYSIYGDYPSFADNDVVDWMIDMVNDMTLEDFLPKLTDQLNPISLADNFYRQVNSVSEPISTIVSLNLSEPTGDFHHVSIMGSSGEVYASKENIYLTGYAYTYNTDVESAVSTAIHRFDISTDPSMPKYITSGSVDGYLHDQFSMDEYESNFRIVTTGYTGSFWDSTTETNNLFVLDSNLKTIGEIRNMASDETVYSARFIGNKAYVVTYRTMDPLFTINLSDPTNPIIEGALKISGYADYIHPLDDTHLLTLGKETTDENGWTSVSGVKIDINDVSDFANPILSQRIVIGDGGTDSEALYTHKAFSLFNSIFSLPITIWETNGSVSLDGFIVFKLNEDFTLTELARIDHRTLFETTATDEISYYATTNYIRRTVFIDNMMYTISEYGIMAYDTADFSTPIQTLSFVLSDDLS